jgi:hypothetical protein
LGLGGSVAQARAAQPVSTTQPHHVALPNSTAYFNGTFQTLAGYYLTAVGGGGRTSDVIHTNATRPQAWERFNRFFLG